MSELESYGGVFDCQRFRDVMMYSVSVFSYGLPRAMEILADCIWRPKITQEEVGVANAQTGGWCTMYLQTARLQ